MSFSFTAFINWVHDELTALRADVARLQSHTSVPSAGVPKPADAVPDPQAQFGPVPPPATPEAPAAPVPLPPGGNTTDATAPGYHAPAEAAAPAPAPAEPAAPGMPPLSSMTWAEFQAAGGTVYVTGTVSATISECPTDKGYRVLTIDRSGYPSGPYDCAVNGVSKHSDNPLNTLTVSGQGPTLEITVTQQPGNNVNLQIQ